MAYSIEDHSRVANLLAMNVPINDVVKRTGIPFSTIKTWRDTGKLDSLIASFRNDKKIDLDALAADVIEGARTAFNRCIEILPQSKGMTPVITFGTLVDKFMVLTGQDKQRLEISGPDGEPIKFYIPKNGREK